MVTASQSKESCFKKVYPEEIVIQTQCHEAIDKPIRVPEASPFNARNALGGLLREL